MCVVIAMQAAGDEDGLFYFQYDTPMIQFTDCWNEDFANVPRSSSVVHVVNGKAASFKDINSRTSFHLDVSHLGIKMIFIIFLPD